MSPTFKRYALHILLELDVTDKVSIRVPVVVDDVIDLRVGEDVRD